MEFIFNKTIKGSEIKRFRDEHNLNTKDFGKLVGISSRTIERWEYSDELLKGPIISLLSILKEQPNLIEKNRIPEKRFPLRLYYMHENSIGTIIDVDIMNRKVEFKNFSNKIDYRAFGSREEVTYEDYENFLKSRCFPESRDRMNIILEELGIPFYDPYLIIRKTKGKMAEDDCWIQIEE